MFQFGKRLQPRKHTDWPAIGQISIQPRGLIDIGAAKGGLGEAVDGAALQVVGDPAAHLETSRFRSKDSGELGRALRGVLGLFKCGGQGKDRRQIGLKLAHHAVKLGLRHGGSGLQTDIGILEGDGCRLKRGHRLDPNFGRVGPGRGGHAQTDDTVLPTRRASGRCGRNDAHPGAFGIGGAGVKTGPRLIHHKAQREGCDHRTWRGDLEADTHALGLARGEACLETALLLV